MSATDCGISQLQGQTGKALLQVSKQSVSALLRRSDVDAGVALSVLTSLGVLRAPALYRPVAQWHSVALASLACAGGGLHGVALGVRKRSCSGDTSWWTQCLWWLSFLCDGWASLLIWPAMPIISVELLMPMVLVPQLVVSYAIGCLFMGDAPSARRQTGIAFSIIGTLGLGMSTPVKAEHFDIDTFWFRCQQTNFLLANACCGCLIIFAFLGADKSHGWACLAAFGEAMQYILTRAIAKVFFGGGADLSNPTILCVFLAKSLFFLLIIGCQQCGLSASKGLSSFSGVYLMATVLLTCTQGAVFFGDPIVLSEAFVISAMGTAVGMSLLIQPDAAGPAKEDDRSVAGKFWWLCLRRPANFQDSRL